MKWTTSFWPSARFVGEARGFVFKLGPLGLGYYNDSLSVERSIVHNKKDIDLCPALSCIHAADADGAGRLCAMVDFYVRYVKALPTWVMHARRGRKRMAPFVAAYMRSMGAKEESVRLRNVVAEESGWRKICQRTARKMKDAIKAFCAEASHTVRRDMAKHLVAALNAHIRVVDFKSGKEGATMNCARWNCVGGILASDVLVSLLAHFFGERDASSTEDALFVDLAALLPLLSKISAHCAAAAISAYSAARLRQTHCGAAQVDRGCSVTMRFAHTLIYRKQLTAAHLRGHFAARVAKLLGLSANLAAKHAVGARNRECANQLGAAVVAAVHSFAEFGITRLRHGLHAHEGAAFFSHVFKCALRVLLSGKTAEQPLSVRALLELCRLRPVPRHLGEGGAERGTSVAPSNATSSTCGLLLECATVILKQFLGVDFGNGTEAGHTLEEALHWIGMFVAMATNIACADSGKPGTATTLTLLRRQVLRAVTTVWLHPNVGVLGKNFLSVLISVVNKLISYESTTNRSGPGKRNGGVAMGRSGGGQAELIRQAQLRLGPLLCWDMSGLQNGGQKGPEREEVVAAPDPGSVQTLLNMGFCRSSAERALVRSSSVELAIQWLLTNPDEASRSASAADVGQMLEVATNLSVDAPLCSSFASGELAPSETTNRSPGLDDCTSAASHQQRLKIVSEGSSFAVSRCAKNAFPAQACSVAHRSLCVGATALLKRINPAPAARCALLANLGRRLVNYSQEIRRTPPAAVNGHLWSEIALLSRAVALLLSVGDGVPPRARLVAASSNLSWVVISLLERGARNRAGAFWALPCLDLLHILLTDEEHTPSNDDEVGESKTIGDRGTGYRGDALLIRALRMCIVAIRMFADASVVRSALLLCAQLMEAPQVAVRFLPLGGLHALLALQSSGAFCGHTIVMGIILKRALCCTCSIDGEPGMAQATMEPIICRAAQRSKKGCDIDAFLKEVGCLAARDCSCFLRACAACVELVRPADSVDAQRIVVILREHRANTAVGQNARNPWALRAATVSSQLCSMVLRSPSASSVPVIKRGAFGIYSLLRLLSGLVVALPRSATRALCNGCFDQNLHTWLLHRALPVDRGAQHRVKDECTDRHARDRQRASASTSIAAMRFLRILCSVAPHHRGMILRELAAALHARFLGNLVVA